MIKKNEYRKVIIGSLTPHGVLTSFKVKPLNKSNKNLADRYREIYPNKYDNEVDMGGIRIYNSKVCSILKTNTKVQSFNSDFQNDTR